MQRMALPVVLTAEGTTFRLTHNSSKHVLRKVTTCSSLNLVRLSVALNGKIFALAAIYRASGSFGPIALHCGQNKLFSLLTYTRPGDPLDLCRVSGRGDPHVYKTDRFQQNLQVISRKGESKSLPYARTNGEPYGLLSAMF
jgi:hypothetical protein